MLLRASRHSSRLALPSIRAGSPPWVGAPTTIVLAPTVLAYSATIRPAAPWSAACSRIWPSAGTWCAASRSRWFRTTARAVSRLSPAIATSPAADEPDEAVGRRRDRLLHRGDGHDGLGGDRVVDPDEDAGDDHGRDQHRAIPRPERDDQHHDRERAQVRAHGLRDSQAGLQLRRAAHG